MSYDATEAKIASLRWAIGLSALLSLMKAVVGFVCASTALIASALDSLMDVGVSSINYLSVRKGSKPPDSDHAYGHEKIESLASYSQGIIILLFAFGIFVQSFRQVSSHNTVLHSGIALVVIVIASLVNLVITGILYRTEQKTGSLIVKAEKMHYLMDIFSYCLIFAVLLLVRWTGWSGWDIVCGMILAVYVGYLAYKILIQSANELVDRSLPRHVLDELDHLIRNHDPNVLGYHELRTRKVGNKNFIDFHLELRSRQSFQSAHQIAESLEEKIKAKFENADVTIHEDPGKGQQN